MEIRYLFRSLVCCIALLAGQKDHLLVLLLRDRNNATLHGHSLIEIQGNKCKCSDPRANSGLQYWWFLEGMRVYLPLPAGAASGKPLCSGSQVICVRHLTENIVSSDILRVWRAVGLFV